MDFYHPKHLKNRSHCS